MGRGICISYVAGLAIATFPMAFGIAKSAVLWAFPECKIKLDATSNCDFVTSLNLFGFGLVHVGTGLIAIGTLIVAVTSFVHLKAQMNKGSRMLPFAATLIVFVLAIAATGFMTYMQLNFRL